MWTDRHQLIVRDGKGGKDRITMLADRLVEPLKTHLDKVAVLHKKDLSEGFGGRILMSVHALFPYTGGARPL